MNGERRIAGFALACLAAGDPEGAEALEALAEPLRGRVRAQLDALSAHDARLAWIEQTLEPDAPLPPRLRDPALRRALQALHTPADAAAERAALREAGWPA